MNNEYDLSNLLEQDSARQDEVDVFEYLDKTTGELEKIVDLLSKKEFKEFIGKKCVEELKKLSENVLNGVKDDDVAYSEVKKYIANHQFEVGDDYIYIFNDTMADLSHLSPATTEKYSEGLSIAQLIEYGMGIYGSPQEDYPTMVNPDRNYSKEWSYKRNGSVHRSMGMNGKFIYQTLVDYFDMYFDEWIEEYMKTRR